MCCRRWAQAAVCNNCVDCVRNRGVISALGGSVRVCVCVRVCVRVRVRVCVRVYPPPRHLHAFSFFNYL